MSSVTGHYFSHRIRTNRPGAHARVVLAMIQEQENVVAGNYFDKYRSPNPIHRLLVRNFLCAARELILCANPSSVLEVGAGPGDLAANLFLRPAGSQIEYLGTDISPRQIQIAKERYPDLSFQCSSVYELPIQDKSFDLSMACELLEHLEHPSMALAELARVTRRFVLVSVPWEPTWRILNCLRGKYLASLGNTPGHIQHFSRRAIRAIVSHGFTIVEQRVPFPWTMLLAQVDK